MNWVVIGSPWNLLCMLLHCKYWKSNIQTIRLIIYARYVDDKFVEIKTEGKLIKLKENSSVFEFTYEKTFKNKLIFLNKLLPINNDKIDTTIYR